MRSLASHCLIAAQFAVVMAAVMPRQCRADDPAAALHEALGSPDPLYKFPSSALAAAVKLCSVNDPAHAGAYVTVVLVSGRNDADAIAPALVQAAIQGLGADPASDLVAAIVSAAVKAAPSEVLDIVTAAVKASPRATAPAIVTAAVSSVPHPEQLVTVNVQRRAERAAGMDKQLDAKALPEEQKQLTLAEAIVQAALDADPSLNADELTTASDSGLTSTFSPGRTFILTSVLAPVVPVLPSTPVITGNSGLVFGQQGPVSP
jgi:hypothetical protein